MKKAFAALLALITVISLSACIEKDEKPLGNTDSFDNPQVEGSTEDTGSEDKPSNTDDSGSEEKPDVPDDSGSEEKPDVPDGTTSIEGFLGVYGFTKEDITPAHLLSFDDVTMDGKAEAGEISSVGFIKINVDKDATTREDINAWFDKVYAKMAELSADGKLYSNYLMEKEATSIEDLKEGVLWEDFPGGSCFYTYDLAIGRAKIMVATRYTIDTGVYNISITTWGPAD